MRHPGGRKHEDNPSPRPEPPECRNLSGVDLQRLSLGRANSLFAAAPLHIDGSQYVAFGNEDAPINGPLFHRDATPQMGPPSECFDWHSHRGEMTPAGPMPEAP